ncbi:MAG: hypothetical protein RBR53_01445 [Desulforegulaceae bacterium]|nr:hypothetical protein [Desulforegulaceae bacterium]
MNKEVNNSMENQIANSLFSYSVSRDDLKTLAKEIIENTDAEEQTLLYELQILKIITTGVSINYLIKSLEKKNEISKFYWEYILEFSKSVTEAAKSYSNVDIDYFKVIKDKLDYYLEKLSENKNAPEPASVIGPAFATQCSMEENVFTILGGAKLYKGVMAGLKAYYEKEGI